MRIVFMGTPDAAVVSLERLRGDGHEIVSVWTQPDKPAGRGDVMHSPPVKTFALAHSLPVEQRARIKTNEAKELFASYSPELTVVVAYGRILPTEYLKASAKGCINVHFSLLPKYRGAAPVNWAIVRGEEKTGVSTMFIEEELDSGPVLMQRETTIGASETAPQLTQRLAEIGADVLSETLANLGDLKPRSQDHANASFAPMLKKPDGLIDWNMDASHVERRVRGFQPWPNAYTFHGSKRLIVWHAAVVDEHSPETLPGTITGLAGDDLVVRCGGKTSLRLLELQPEAKRRMSVKDFLNGTHLRIGDRFGQV